MIDVATQISDDRISASFIRLRMEARPRVTAAKRAGLAILRDHLAMRLSTLGDGNLQVAGYYPWLYLLEPEMQDRVTSEILETPPEVIQAKIAKAESDLADYEAESVVKLAEYSQRLADIESRLADCEDR